MCRCQPTCAGAHLQLAHTFRLFIQCLQEAIEMFIEIAEAHPRFLRKQLPEVVGAMLQVRGRSAFHCCSDSLFAIAARSGLAVVFAAS